MLKQLHWIKESDAAAYPSHLQPQVSFAFDINNVPMKRTSWSYSENYPFPQILQFHSLIGLFFHSHQNLGDAHGEKLCAGPFSWHQAQDLCCSGRGSGHHMPAQHRCKCGLLVIKLLLFLLPRKAACQAVGKLGRYPPFNSSGRDTPREGKGWRGSLLLITRDHPPFALTTQLLFNSISHAMGRCWGSGVPLGPQRTCCSRGCNPGCGSATSPWSFSCYSIALVGSFNTAHRSTWASSSPFKAYPKEQASNKFVCVFLPEVPFWVVKVAFKINLVSKSLYTKR